jgi:hypothetical protein
LQAEIEQDRHSDLASGDQLQDLELARQKPTSGLRSCVRRWPRWMCVRRPLETWELRYEPSRASMRNAPSSSLENALFKTKARALERIAVITEFSSSYMEE